jgi:hypothetical protein
VDPESSHGDNEWGLLHIAPSLLAYPKNKGVALDGKVTVQWCPQCKGWNQSRSLSRDLLQGVLRAGDPLVPIEYQYLQNRHQCGACSEHFVTIEPAKVEPGYRWQIGAELVKIRQRLSTR